MTTPATSRMPSEAPADDGTIWIADRLDALASAVDGAARSADPVAAIAPHRIATAELRGVARIDAAPPLGAVLDVVGRLAGTMGAGAPAAALVQPTLELAGRALQEGAAALRGGHLPSVDSATVLALAALVRAARPAVTASSTVQPIGTLVGDGATSTPRPAAIARFRAETVGAAERLRAALARVRAARDPITSDEAVWEAMRFAAHLASHAAEYGLSAVADCLETARRGLATLDPRALWVLDEAGVELAEPGTPVEGVLPRFHALRARLDGVQPPPSGASPVSAGSSSHALRAAARPAVMAPAVASTVRHAEAPVPRNAAPSTPSTSPEATAGAMLADLLRDGIAAFTAQGAPILGYARGDALGDTAGDVPPTSADSGRTAMPATLPDATELAYRGPSARAAARALREALERGERAATPAATDELNDLLRLAEE